MTLPDHGRDLLDNLVGPEVVEVAICDGKRRVPQLPLNDADIDSASCQHACARMPESMYMDTLAYAPEYRVTCGQFTHVAGIEAKAVVACEEKAICIVGPGGYPVVKLPRCLTVDPNHPTLVSFTLEYSDGAVFQVHVTHSKTEDFAAPQLCAECQKKDAAVAESSNRRLVERRKETIEFRISKHLGG